MSLPLPFSTLPSFRHSLSLSFVTNLPSTLVDSPETHPIFTLFNLASLSQSTLNSESPDSRSTTFDPLKGYTHSTQTPPSPPPSSHEGPPSTRRTTRTTSQRSTKSDRMNQPTSASSARKVKPQPPQHPNLFQTQREWDVSTNSTLYFSMGFRSFARVRLIMKPRMQTFGIIYHWHWSLYLLYYPSFMAGQRIGVMQSFYCWSLSISTNSSKVPTHPHSLPPSAPLPPN